MVATMETCPEAMTTIIRSDCQYHVTVFGEHGIAGQQAHGLGQALGHEHTVERVTMMRGKLGDLCGMFPGNGQLGKTARFDGRLDRKGVGFDLAKRSLDGNLPDRSSADENGVVRVL